MNKYYLLRIFHVKNLLGRWNASRLLLLLILPLLWQATLSAQTTFLGNNQPANNSAEIKGIATDGTNIYFAGVSSSSESVFDLFVSDGTESGTVNLTEAIPDANFTVIDFVLSGGTVFFTAVNRGSGTRTGLYTSDGTVAGTQLVKNLGLATKNLTILGDLIYFTSQDEVLGAELWVSDGTEEGTHIVRDIALDFVTQVNDANPNSLMPLGDNLVFLAFSQDFGNELWITDGTEDGTRLLRDVVPGTGGVFNPTSTFRNSFTQFNDELYFSLSTPDAGAELWKTDGTEMGTTIVKDIADGTRGSNPSGFFEFNGALYFMASNELWQTDGTESGTVMVSTEGRALSSDPIFQINDRFYYFRSTIIGGGDSELWSSDGTTAGTVQVTSFGRFFSGTKTLFLGHLNGEAIFATNGEESDETSRGVELWKTDGTESGTMRFTDLFPGTADGVFEAVEQGSSSAVLGNQLFFYGDNGLSGQTLFVTDGTEVNTSPVLQVNQSGKEFVQFQYGSFLNVGSDTYFTMPNAVGEFWRTDGTAEGTMKVSEFPADVDVRESQATLLPGQGAVLTSGNIGLWALDQNFDNPVQIINETGSHISPGGSFEDSEPAIVLNDRYIFGGAGNGVRLVTSDELYATNSTLDGVELIKDIRPGAVSSMPGFFMQLSDKVVFSAQSGDSKELWVTDGTEGGTVKVNDSAPIDVGVIFDDQAIYPSASGIVSTDGTTDGTTTVLPFANTTNFVKAGDRLFFTVPSGVDRGLWITDLTDISEANSAKITSSTGVTRVINIGDTFYYIDSRDLYETDGTEGNSSRVIAGPILEIVNVGSQLYFLRQTDSGITTFQIFSGDIAGIVDVPGTSELSNFHSLHVNGNTIYYRAFSDATGTELYSYSAPVSAAISLRAQTESNGLFSAALLENGLGSLSIDNTVYNEVIISPQDFVISNSGQSDLTFPSDPTITGVHADSFELVDFPTSVAAGTAAAFKIRYTGNLTTGSQAVIISITTNDPVTPVYTFEVSVANNAKAQADGPFESLEPKAFLPGAALDFGRVQVGNEVLDTIFYQNRGFSPLVIENIRFEGDAAGDFSVRDFIGLESQTILHYSSPLLTPEEQEEAFLNDPDYRAGIVIAYSPAASGLREAALLFDANTALQDVLGFTARVPLAGQSTCNDIGDIGPSDQISLCTNLAETVTLSIPEVPGAEYCWGNVGWQELTRLTSQASFRSDLIITEAGIPVIATSSSSGAINIFQYQDEEFTQLGAVDFARVPGTATPFFELIEQPGGNLIFAYIDAANSSRVTVKEFNGTDWVTLGVEGVSAGRSTEVNLAADASSIYLGFSDGSNFNRASVLTFDGTDWVPVGNTRPTVASALSMDLKVNNGVPYLAFKDGTQPDGGISVVKYENSEWQSVGDSGFSAGEVNLVSLEFDSNDIPYVAYADLVDNTLGLQSFNGTTWANIGRPVPEFAANNVREYTFVINGTTPYVGFFGRPSPRIYGFQGESWSRFQTSIQSGFRSSFAVGNEGELFNVVIHPDGFDSVIEQLIVGDCLGTTNSLVVSEPGFYQVTVNIVSEGCITTSNNIVEVIGITCEPDIVVQGNDRVITDGSTSVSTSNNTDFPRILPDQTESLSYNIINTGMADLELTLPLTLTGDDAARFEITEQPGSATVAPSDTISFTVAHTPVDFTTSEAMVNISSNVADASPYTFTIAGRATSFTLDMTDAIITDVNEDGMAGAGDVIRYTSIITKVPGSSLSNDVVLFALEFTSINTLGLEVGSVTTTRGSVLTGNTSGDESVAVGLVDMDAEETATVTFDVTVDENLPDNEEFIKEVARLTTNFSEFERFSDDPDLPGNIDSTRTAIGRGILLASASRDTDTQITVSFNVPAVTNGGNPTDFTVTDGLGNIFEVAAQADGTAGDMDIVLTVADLSSAVGDLTVTYANNNGEIEDTNGSALETDEVGVSIDIDTTAPTLVSGVRDSDTQITLTFSEPVQTNEGNPADFTVVDADNTVFAVSAQVDDTANDTEVVLTVADFGAATGPLTVTYTNNNNEISDFGGNDLATDATGVEVALNPTVTAVSVPANDSYIAGEDLSFVVTFDRAITITGTPRISLTIGTTDVNATLNGTVTDAAMATFTYTVQSGEEDTDGIALGTAIDLNGATIQDADNLDAILDLNNVASTTQVRVDAIAPAAPVIVSISDDNGSSDSDRITNDPSLIVRGTAEANSTLSLLVNGEGIFGGITLPVDGDGNWEFDPVGEGTFTLEEGVHTYTATTEDAAGNESPVSENFVVTVDLTAPVAPTLDLTASGDLGISDTDNLTSGTLLTLNGTAEPNNLLGLFLVDEDSNPIEGRGGPIGTTDAEGNWTFSEAVGFETGTYRLIVLSQDIAGNGSEQSEILTVVYDQEIGLVSTSPVDNEVDVLPNANLTLTFDENVLKGTGNIQIIQLDDGEVQQTIDVTGDNVTVDGATVTINPPANILPPDTEFYVNIDAGAFENEAGAGFAGISDNTTFSFTIIAASVVSEVTVPADDNYKIGDELDFTVNMVLPVTVTGTPTIPVTIGDEMVNASLVGTATNTATLTFRYTVVEGDLDVDGLAVGTAMNLNGGTMRDEFDVDAILTLNSVANTSGVLVDGVIPAAPVIVSISDDTGLANDDQITNDQSLFVTGTAEPNSTLSLLVDGEGIFGGITLIVDSEGNWEFSPVGEGTFTLEEGVHTYTATTEDAAGNVSPVSENFVITVDLTAPDQPTIDLDASTDLGISNSDNLTSGAFITLNGTAEPNSTVLLSLVNEEGDFVDIDGNPIDVTDIDPVAVDGSGNWTSTGPALPSGTFPVGVVAQDDAGNLSTTSEILTLVFDQEIGLVSTSPVDDEIDVLPNANLTLTFDENVVKGTGNIQIIQLDDGEVQQTIDITGGNVTIDGTTVTIDPAENILPPDTEFYVNIDEGAFENEAGAAYAGISDNTTFSFTIIAASVVSEVTVPTDDTYVIGNDLDFVATMVLPVSITGGTPSIPVTIGENTVNATLVGTVTNSSTLTFRYTIQEGDVDADGIAVGTAIELNGAIMRDEFEVDAILTLNNVGATTAVLVDAIRPDAPIISSITEDTGTSNSDGLTNDADFVINGTAEANATLRVEVAFSDASGTGTTANSNVPVDENGDWSFGFGSPFSDRDYQITATATDTVGNVGSTSDSFALTIDTTAPDQPTIDLDASTDLGISNSDNLTSGAFITLNGTAEPNSTVLLSLVNEEGDFIDIEGNPIDVTDIDPVAVDGSGNWTSTGPALPSGTFPVGVIAKDAAGNLSTTSEILTLVFDQEIGLVSTSPVDDEIDVLPNANLTLTFDKNIVKGTGTIQIIQSDNDQVQQTIDVTGDNVTIDGATVTIDPPANILPPDTEFYVNIDAGAFENEAGAAYAGISDNTTFSFTIIAASVVTSVDVPADDTYMIGDQLDFTANMVLPVSITGTATIPVTIGDNVVNATQVGTVSNASSITFRYTVVENDFDADGIMVGNAINLNGGTMRDEFDVDAILTLNNVGATTAVLVDAVKPIPTLSTTAPAVVNDPFSVTITLDEAITGMALTDINVVNGTASNLVEVTTGTVWTVDITPTVAGDVVVSMLADVVNDLAGNPSKASSNSITRQYNNNPTDISLSTMNINENNEPTATVATISTTDVDATDTHIYSLVAGMGDTDNGTFTISGNNLNVNNTSFNFENGNTSFSIRVRTDDGVAGGTFEEVFTITVNDVNEVPSMLSLSNNSIDEDDEAQDVGMLVALDQDGGETFSYTLVTGTGSDDNAEFEINGNTLRTAGLINFEDGTTRSILVRVTDSGGLTLDQQFTINIGEVVIEPLREFTNIPGGAVRNIFSPNGDGVNETWVIEDLLDNPVNEVKVYAQGGKLIFSQVNYRNDWDGTFRGDPLPDGTYYYEINVYDGERIIKGFLTIIRNR